MSTFDETFSLPLPRGAFGKYAVRGWQDDLAIAVGFSLAAENVAKGWIEQKDDLLVPPILYLYRHSIELSLKWCIRLAARMAVNDGYAGQENLSPATVDEKLVTHRIAELADRLNRYIGFITSATPTHKLDRGTLKQLRDLDAEDQFGDTYRYATHTTGAAVHTSVERIDFHQRFDALNKLANLLHGEADHLQSLAGLMAEAAEEVPDLGEIEP